MNQREFIRLIIHHGKVDSDIFHESSFVEDSWRIKEVFRILQEIDSTVHMNFFPMELDFLKIHEMKDTILINKKILKLINIHGMFIRMSSIPADTTFGLQ